MAKNSIDLTKVKEFGKSGAEKIKGVVKVFRYTNEHINIFSISRKNSYRELRYAPKTEYKSAEEFLVSSVHAEAFPMEASIHVSWMNLETKSCSNSELKDMYSELQKKITKLPTLSEVKSSTLITTGFEFKWLFIEGSENYYSVFWRDTEKKLLKLCA